MVNITSAIEGLATITSLRLLENHRTSLNLSSVVRSGNVDLIPPISGNEVIPVCHVVNMNTFLHHGPAALVATTLALEHLNTGNGSIIPEVEGLSDRCPLRFTSEFIDTASNKLIAMERLIDVLQRDNEEQQPCAFLGNSFSPVSIATSVVTGIKGYPQVSVTSSSSQLDDKTIYPLFSRVGVSSDHYATPLVTLLYETMGVRNVAVVVTKDEDLQSLATGVLEQSLYTDLFTPKFTLPANATALDYRHLMHGLDLQGILFMVTFVLPHQMEPMMDAALQHGVAGTGNHTWVHNGLSFTALSPNRTLASNSTLAKVAQGSFLYSPSSSVEVAGLNPFALAMDSLLTSEEDRGYLNSKLPSYFEADSSFSPSNSVSNTDALAAMMYDSAILVGLSACSTSNPSNLTGEEHYAAMLQTEFQGSSGFVSLDHATGSRDVKSARFTLLNFFTESTENDDELVVRQQESARYANGSWDYVGAIYSDGTSTFPLDIPPPIDRMNHISWTARLLAFSVATLVLVLSATFSMWTAIEQQKMSCVISAAQPLFLHLICVGTFLMGCSIFPMGLLDERLLSEKSMDKACMATPWLLSFGWGITFSALYAKILRVNMVFHNPNFRRVVVKTRDVLLPMVVMFSVNLIILLAWTFLQPLTWERERSGSDMYGRPLYFGGYCRSQYNRTGFLYILLSVNILPLIFANYQAYVARKISTEFAESEYIALLIALTLMVSFVALPVAVFTNSSNPTVRFYIRAGFVFIISTSTLLLIFLPKVRHASSGRTQQHTIRSAIRNSIQVSNGSSPEHSLTSFTSGCQVIDHPKIAARKIESLEAENAALKCEMEKLRQRATITHPPNEN